MDEITRTSSHRWSVRRAFVAHTDVQCEFARKHNAASARHQQTVHVFRSTKAAEKWVCERDNEHGH